MIDKLILAGLLAGLAPMGMATAQTEEDGAKFNSDVAVLEVDSLTIAQYAPEHVDADRMFQFAINMLARKFLVTDRGVEGGQLTQNMNLLGDTIIVYDEPKNVERILAQLKELDRAPKPRSLETVNLTTFEYRPRYVSLDVIEEALRPFQRQITIDPGSPARNPSMAMNISTVDERSLVVVRETAKTVVEIQSLLDRIDVPEPQVMLTFHAIQGTTEEPEGGPLPEELTKNLERLLPQYRFESLGLAMVQTSAAAGREVLLSIDAGDDEGFEVQFRPVAFDEKTSSLTIERCSVAREIYADVSTAAGSGRQRMRTDRLFSTSTILRGGEYTVLGATGADPVFVVIRLVPVGK